MEGRVGCPSRRGGAYRRDERARAVADRHATSDMSDSNQIAARLAQVARRLEGAGGGFPEASTSGSGPLADDGLPREPTLVTLVDVGTGRAYHAVTLEDGSIVLELSDELADEAVARAARTGSADAHHPTRFTFRRLVRSGGGGDFFGVAHPASGKYLQAKKQGRHRLMFFSHLVLPTGASVSQPLQYFLLVVILLLMPAKRP